MNRYRILRKIVFGGMVIFMTCLVLLGCGEQPPPESPPKAREVRKKISARPGPPKTEPLAVADSAPDKSPEGKPAASDAEKPAASDAGKPAAQESGKPAPDSVKPEQAKGKPREDVKPVPGAVDAKPGDAVQTAAVKTDGKSEVEESSASPSDAGANEEEDVDALAAISVMDAEDASKFKASYNPKGKADPFEPLLREQPKKPEKQPSVTTETLSDEPSKPKPPPRRLTPLEKLDLGQLKLVGIIRSTGGNRALVEEASGKGYIIVKGTPIGIHSGVVVDILPDRVVVEEQNEDALGKVTMIKRILKFNRPDEEGEELL